MYRFFIHLFAFAVISLTFASVAAAAAGGEAAANLTDRERGIVPIAAFTANGDLDRLKAALNEGLDRGLTVNEIKEVLIQMYAYSGFPRSLNAIDTFMAVTEERAARGIRDEMGREAAPLPTDRSREQMGRDVRSGLVGGEFPPAGFALFVPTIDLFLKEHLFADIFLRDNLDHRSREIATIAALAALQVPAQLRSHINIGMNVGIHERQMNDLISVLADRVGGREADLARAELKNVIGARTPLPQKGSEMKTADRTAFERVNVFGTGAPNTAYAQYFTGESFLNPLTDPEKSAVFLANVTFEPGCRNNWHIHHASRGGGQILICTAGSGWYQEEGKEAVSLEPGSVITIPAGVRHWHGAKADSWFSHIAVEVPGDDTRNEWREPVSEEEYSQLKD